MRYEYRRNGYDLICHPNNGEGVITNRSGTGQPRPSSGDPDGLHLRRLVRRRRLSGTLYVATTMPAHNLELWAKWWLYPVISLPCDDHHSAVQRGRRDSVGARLGA